MTDRPTAEFKITLKGLTDEELFALRLLLSGVAVKSEQELSAKSKIDEALGMSGDSDGDLLMREEW